MHTHPQRQGAASPKERIMNDATLSTVRPPEAQVPPNTSRAKMDEVIDRLLGGAAKFSALPLHERIALARSMQNGYMRVAEASVKATCAAKGIPLEHHGAEFALGPWIPIRAFRLIIESLEALERRGNTSIGRIAHTRNGRLAVRVFPANSIDSVLFSNVVVDVHMATGVTEKDLATRASFYKQPGLGGGVTLVFGAGNIEAIPSFDIITKMFNEGKVCVVKMNPVNAYLGAYLEQAYREPIERGFLAFVYGGVEEGAYLAQHPGVDDIHLTGSDKTYETLVWGPPGLERERRKARDERVLDKSITAELGNVSPVIVVPGSYTERELRYQAEEVAGALALNASYCCCAPKVLVTAKGWATRDKFLRMVEEVLERMPPRVSYYPGAAERYRLFTADRDKVRKFGAEDDRVLPWTLVTDLDPESTSDLAFNRESFCPVLFETALTSADPADFLDRAVRFANETLWGTLNATIITARDADSATVLEDAIRDLRYGTVAVNAYPAMSFAFGTPPWGAYPGADARDIQSGTGFVHNTAMLEGIEKVVMRHPLTTFPKPAYFPSHRSVAHLMPRLTALDEHASWLKVPSVVATAMRC
jgi:Aldehyde dehydrogenase family